VTGYQEPWGDWKVEMQYDPATDTIVVEVQERDWLERVVKIAHQWAIPAGNLSGFLVPAGPVAKRATIGDIEVSAVHLPAHPRAKQPGHGPTDK
jgi:hypothetical protein